ncbi:MAG: phosphoribosylanthranilate isomerase [Chloroflexota bacterium]|nr:phosphoribosylanthranilate isomerase [Chloroflexota bacterium]
MIGSERIAPGSIKICGLREPDHARVAVGAGATLIGFIFAPARRRVDVATARAAIEAARSEAGSRVVLAVGVFVDADAEEMNATAETAGLDLLQLHGDEPPALLAQLRRPVIKALRIPAGTDAARVESLIASYETSTSPPVVYLLDGFDPAAHGGSGVKADWHLAADLASRWPLMLAGGLTPDNVSAAIRAATPRAVDVSSGVELDGVKDPIRIAAFIAAARDAFAPMAGAGL